MTHKGYELQWLGSTNVSYDIFSKVAPLINHAFEKFKKMSKIGDGASKGKHHQMSHGGGNQAKKCHILFELPSNAFFFFSG